MLYCSYNQYRDLGGQMTAEEYDVWGPMAAGRIDALTLGRAGTHRDRLEQELALANALMADRMQVGSTAAQTGLGLASANNDGYIESYRAGSDLRRDQTGALTDILRDALGADPYGLLWRGVE